MLLCSPTCTYVVFAEILGLTEEQVEELKLKDDWGEKCVPSGGCSVNKDPVGRRNGKQPRKEMQEVLNKAVKDAKEMISKNLVVQGMLIIVNYLI